MMSGHSSVARALLVCLGVFLFALACDQAPDRAVAPNRQASPRPHRDTYVPPSTKMVGLNVHTDVVTTGWPTSLSNLGLDSLKLVRFDFVWFDYRSERVRRVVCFEAKNIREHVVNEG